MPEGFDFDTPVLGDFGTAKFREAGYVLVGDGLFVDLAGLLARASVDIESEEP